MSSVIDSLQAYLARAAERGRVYDFGDDVEEGLHIAGVAVSPCDAAGKQTALITSEGVKLVDATLIGRGVHIAIAFTSELGKPFIRGYHFHKGNVRVRDEATPWLNDCGHADIWRD